MSKFLSIALAMVPFLVSANQIKFAQCVNTRTNEVVDLSFERAKSEDRIHLVANQTVVSTLTDDIGELLRTDSAYLFFAKEDHWGFLQNEGFLKIDKISGLGQFYFKDICWSNQNDICGIVITRMNFKNCKIENAFN